MFLCHIIVIVCFCSHNNDTIFNYFHNQEFVLIQGPILWKEHKNLLCFYVIQEFIPFAL
jgi:hypothetical protein